MRIRAEAVRNIRPGKAQVYLRPEANQLLEEAIRIYGKPIYPTGSGSAGRTKAQQEYYYDRYLNHDGPVAANPNWGRRPHMRFGAIDIDDESARGAMLAAGWVATTPSEWWHFEHPDMVRNGPLYRRWPIVTEFYVSDETTEEDDEMKPIVFKRTEGSAEWSLIAPWLRGPSDLEEGYLVTGDASVGLAWERMYARGSGTANNVNRAGYVAAQDQARTLRGNWVKDGTVSISNVSVSGPDNAEVLKALDELREAVERPRTLS